MPSPKDGKAGTAVGPTDPKDSQEADKADPGEVDAIKAEQRQTQTGKYGSVQFKPYKPPQTQDEKGEKDSWIEIELLDEEQQPVPGRRYRITLPDSSTAEGTLDEKGLARLDGIQSGTCQITFPDLDQDAWGKA